MTLKSLTLQNWRNHQKFHFDFNGVTILVGPNASGKTNFLEAIYYLSCGKSFRAKDEALVAWEDHFTRIEAEITSDESGKSELVTAVLENEPKTQKTVMIKGVKVASSKLLGHMTSVLFSPEDIELISTLPEARRRYLNLIISQSDRRYALALVHFRRTLEQRNSLLKRINLGLSRETELEVWDGKFAEYTEEIISARCTYIENINKYISKYYQLLSGTEQFLALEYRPSILPSEKLLGIAMRLAESRPRDVLARVTTIGPHRDDIAFIMDGRNLLTFASRGELRTVILALKLAEVDYLYEVTGKKPILLLDDVFSELDEKRRDLLSQIFVNQQTIITTTDLDHVSDNIVEKAKVINLG